MKILVVSDLHLEFHQDGGIGLLDELAKVCKHKHVDALVVAGDLHTQRGLKDVLREVSNLFSCTIFISGNHDFYYGDWRNIENIRQSLKLPNVHWLDNDVVTIQGIRFVGSTLWFEEDPLSVVYENLIADFTEIRGGFRGWVYGRGTESVEFLRKNVRKGDVVITHHLPSYQSVAMEYKGYHSNRYFVSPAVENIILERQPKIHIHGHTHCPCSYVLGKTRVLCNPFGYPGENRHFNPGLVVEL